MVPDAVKCLNNVQENCKIDFYDLSTISVILWNGSIFAGLVRKPNWWKYTNLYFSITYWSRFKISFSDYLDKTSNQSKGFCLSDVFARLKYYNNCKTYFCIIEALIKVVRLTWAFRWKFFEIAHVNKSNPGAFLESRVDRIFQLVFWYGKWYVYRHIY